MPAVVTIKHPRPGEWLIDIVETSVSNGETVTIQPEANEKLPKSGRILRVQSVLVSGAASQVMPTLSDGTSFTANEVIVQAGSATEVDEQPDGGVIYGITTDKMYHRCNPNAGSNNVVRTRYLIQDGWG